MPQSLNLTEPEFANLSGIYSYLEVDAMSFQEEQFVLLVVRGMSIAAAERGAGLCKSQGHRILKKENVIAVVDYLRHQMLADTRVSVETLNSMIFEAHRKSISATEELNAVEKLGKVNMIGAYAPTAIIQKRIQMLEQEAGAKDITPKSSKALERMDDEDLLEMADFDGMDNLDPVATPRPVEGEVITKEEADAAEQLAELDDTGGDGDETDETS